MLTKINPCTSCSQTEEGLLERTDDRLENEKEIKSTACYKRVRHELSPSGYLDNASDYEPLISLLPDSEEANLKIKSILESVDNSTRLLDFIGQIGPTTRDQGQLLNHTASAEISKFQEFVHSLYKTRKQDTDELLGEEQMKLKKRYEEWEASVLQQAQTSLRKLQRLIPEFNYDLYKKDPDYIYSMLRAVSNCYQWYFLNFKIINYIYITLHPDIEL